MTLFSRKTALQKEWDALQKREEKLLQSRRERKQSALDGVLSEKVPAGLQSTLDAAFLKAFTLIFEKGTGVLEKTYSREKLEQAHAVDRFAAGLKPSRKNLRAPVKKANRTGGSNTLLSGAAGIGLGVLGIGLPDIPLFTGQLLRSLYELALRYGYGYDTAAERYFILLLIQGGLACGDALGAVNAQVDAWIDAPHAPEALQDEIARAAQTLSRELLYMKFLQGIPIVGAVGGAYDLVYMKRINAYAALKYRRRYLHDLISQ